ncbi:MAG: hypothetical protein PF495_12015 [Spirochaetales bacterium]|nr:hypothetical protein [Spirochaetales bacterium]
MLDFKPLLMMFLFIHNCDMEDMHVSGWMRGCLRKRDAWVLRLFATKLETAETMEDVALNMRAPYFYPTSTQKFQQWALMGDT